MDKTGDEHDNLIDKHDIKTMTVYWAVVVEDVEGAAWCGCRGVEDDDARCQRWWWRGELEHLVGDIASRADRSYCIEESRSWKEDPSQRSQKGQTQ